MRSKIQKLIFVFYPSEIKGTKKEERLFVRHEQALRYPGVQESTDPEPQGTECLLANGSEPVADAPPEVVPVQAQPAPRAAPDEVRHAAAAVAILPHGAESDDWELSLLLRVSGAEGQ